MTIEQKAREIAEVVWNRTADETNQWASISGFEQEEFARHVKAGIIEGLEMAAKALQDDAKQCDCSAREESECACGAWCEWKTIPSHRAVEIVRALIEEQKL